MAAPAAQVNKTLTITACFGHGVLYCGAVLLVPAPGATAKAWVAAGTACGRALVRCITLPPMLLDRSSLPSASSASSASSTPAAADAMLGAAGVGQCDGSQLLWKLSGHEGPVHRVKWLMGPPETPPQLAPSTPPQQQQPSCEQQQQQCWLLLGTCSDDRTARLWQIPLPASADQLPPVQLSPVQLLPVLTLVGHGARVWDVDALLPPSVQLPTLLVQGASCAAAAPPLLLATASEDCTSRLWDGTTGHQLTVMRVRQQQACAGTTPPCAANLIRLCSAVQSAPRKGLPGVYVGTFVHACMCVLWMHVCMHTAPHTVQTHSLCGLRHVCHTGAWWARGVALLPPAVQRTVGHRRRGCSSMDLECVTLAEN